MTIQFHIFNRKVNHNPKNKNKKVATKRHPPSVSDLFQFIKLSINQRVQRILCISEHVNEKDPSIRSIYPKKKGAINTVRWRIS